MKAARCDGGSSARTSPPRRERRHGAAHRGHRLLVADKRAIGRQRYSGASELGPWQLPAVLEKSQVVDDPQLRGLSVYFQALVADPAANALKITTSNGLKATVQ